MNLGRRFFLLNSITVLIAIVATSVAAVVFFAVLASVYGRNSTMEDLKRVYEVRAGFGEIKRRAAAANFENFLDAGFQKELAVSVKALGADAALVKNREIIFSTKKMDRLDLEKCLGFLPRNDEEGVIELNNRTYILDYIDFNSHEGSKELLLLMAPVKVNMQFYQILILFTISFFVLTFVGLNLWVSISFSKGVIAPVSRLKKAASLISSGDLSCEIVEEGEGEVRELCRTLEQMRIKLKESVYLQEKYDENRKFLVSSISHDLKTPVTSIKGYIEGVLDGVAKTPEKMQTYLETARDKALLVNAMIDDLLLYSKLDLNQIPFNFEKTDMKKYFEDCVADHQYEFEKARIHIEFVYEAKESIFALIDKERMKRVIQNILDNSKKYMNRTDGKIQLILRETRTSLIIEVKDNGAGIDEEALPYIFERFYRGDASRKSSEGSGLGLAIARQIVEGHDGRIWAVSAPGQGTSILISLKKV
ncbi:MAG: HAMP domain-containing histidine kinase [Clostridia bacterium]|nr:HAMP domain-containing histidine kinase [Clostridia bacterium]